MTARHGKIVTFYSYKGGTGRTMALANVAWILAWSGQRVLAVDWDLESPGLHRFFHPFLDMDLVDETPGVIDLIRNYQWAATRTTRGRAPDWYREYADVSPSTISLEWEFPGGGVLHFMPAGRQNQDYSAALTSVNWDEFYENFGGGLFFDAMRESMKRDYDYVLIDSRTGLSDVAQICTLQLPDVLVALFTFSEQGIDGVAGVTQQIRDQFSQRGIRVLPVPTRIDDAEKEKADNGRAYARYRFAGLPQLMDEAERTRYWGDVEVPYKPFYAYEEIPAVFGDRPGGHGTLRAALERLAGHIADDPAMAGPMLDEPERLRIVGSYTRRRPPHAGDIVICFVPENRPWAEWIGRLLERRGIRSIQYNAESPDTDQALAHDRILAIVSPAFARSRAARNFTLSTRQATAVHVAEMRPIEPFAGAGTIELHGLTESDAAHAVLRALDITVAEADGEDLPAGVRYPGSMPRIWNVGPRNPNFTGRDSVLDTLRGQLMAKGMAVVMPVALHGLGGVGKTQVALEYAHRFKSDYDVVWWINAEFPKFIDESLALLAERLGIRIGPSLPDAARDALDVLRLGQAPYQRWLLIYDNAYDPADLREHLPDGPGHVLVTSRNQSWGAVAAPLEVDVFTRAESIEHLSKRLPTLSAEGADRLAERVGHLPLAVEVAAAWLAETGMRIEDYLSELDTSGTRLLSLDAIWQISLDRLAERTRAGVQLLELCAFMAPSISVDLIYSQTTLEALAPFDPTLRVPGILGRVVQEISRLALARIDLQNGEIQIHRLIQEFLRDRLSPAEQEDRYHTVHRILAGARPTRGDTDDPQNWPQYALIWPHLEPSRAASCDEDAVRTLMIDWVRLLWKRSQHEQALELGRRLELQWSATLGRGAETGRLSEPEARVLLRQLLFLRFHIGNIYRSQGEFERARELDEAVLAAQRTALGEEDLHTLMTAGSLAADLRGLGRYTEALEMDRRTHGRLKDLFGEDFERTLSAANNLAISLRLNGHNEQARDLDDDTVQRRLQVLGQMHSYTLQTQSNLARDYRDLGDYRQSLSILEGVYARYNEVLGPDFIDTLRCATSLATSLRLLGEHERARTLTEETVQRLEGNYPPDHPDVLACRMNLAADLAAAGQEERALAVSAQTLAGYERRLGPNHPYTCMARNNYGCYLVRNGSYDDALVQLKNANEYLLEALGRTSPLAHGTGMNLANVYAATGLSEKALALDRTLQVMLNELHGAQHPVTLSCLMNLSLDLTAVGSHAEARQLRESTLSRLAEVLGDKHPTVEAARRGTRLDRELMPQPI
jgi:cellulose biosynthesis protein BcsQ/tetratricopeptide (TPR) repeat protein